MTTGYGLVSSSEISSTDQIACECMVCHLPDGITHSSVAWELTIHFGGKFTVPGFATILVCEECFQIWSECAPDIDARVVRFQSVWMPVRA